MAKLVTLSTYFDLPSAIVDRLLLDQHGILTFLFDGHLGSVSWVYLPAIRGIRLMVPEAEVDEAREILDDQSHRIDVPEDEHCPECKSDNIFRPSSWLVGLASVMTVGPPVLVQSRRRHCRSCKHNWRGQEGLLV